MADTSTNPLLAFLIELVQRIGKKSPKFFQIISWISGISTAITGLPGFLKLFDITLPAPFNILSNKAVAIASLVGLIISNLTVKDATAIAAAPNNQLPLTAAKDLNIPSPPKQ